MNEPSLWELARSDKQIGAYRLLWLPTWGRPVAVRIERSGKLVTLNAVLLGGDGGYEIGELATSKRVALSERDWDTLVARTQGAGFWNMPTSIDDAGVDGERLVVEGLKNGEFHVVSRWTPKAGEYRDICRLMLDLTGLELGQSTWPPPRPRSTHACGSRCSPRSPS